MVSKCYYCEQIISKSVLNNFNKRTICLDCLAHPPEKLRKEFQKAFKPIFDKLKEDKNYGWDIE